MEYGICVLGIVPLRKEPKDQSEMISQILFGQHFKILEVKTKWICIHLASDNYKGWICSKQYQEITYEDFENISLNRFPLVLSKYSLLECLDSKELVPISIGAILPFYNNGIIKIRKRKYRFKGEISSLSKDDIIKYALKFLNTPYLWGGKGVLGIDCSGFTQLVYSLCGITIPRDAFQQAEIGKKVNFKSIFPGDLIVFINENDRIHHVGIAISNDQIIHASGKVRIDLLSNDGIIHAQSNELTHRLHSIKRIL